MSGRGPFSHAKESVIDPFQKKLFVDFFRLFSKLKLFSPSQMKEIWEDFSRNHKRLGSIAVIKGWINKEQFDVIWDLYNLIDGKIQKQETKFKTVSQIVTMINSIHSLERILHELTFAGKSILEGTSHITFYWERDGFLTYGYSTREFDDDLKGQRIPIGMDFVGYSALHKQSILSNDPRNDTRISSEFGGTDEMDAESIMAVPVISDGELIGVLQAVCKRKDSLYSEDELEILETLANAAAISIRNVRLIEDTKKKLYELRKLNKEKERLWEKLLQSEKLSAIGQLTAGLGHEIGNIIIWLEAGPKLMERIEKVNLPALVSDIRNLAPADGPPEFKAKLDLLAKQMDSIVPDTLEELTVVQEAKMRLARIAADFRQYNKSVPSSEVNLAPHNINKVISDFKMLERKLKSSQLIAGKDVDYQLKLELTPDIPPVMVDKAQFQDILLNLCFNAVDSMPHGGVFKITTDVDDDFVYVRVSDTGSGIPPENRHKVFNPFFTTKAKGTGLGLSICYNIIKQHGGTMWVESEVDKGTTFVIKLPIKWKGEAESPTAELTE